MAATAGFRGSGFGFSGAIEDSYATPIVPYPTPPSIYLSVLR